MKFVTVLLLSSLCSLAIGTLVLLYPDNSSEWLVRVIGGLFLIPAVVSIFVFLGRRYDAKIDERRASFPLASVGSIVLGTFLLVSPSFVQDYIVYLIALFPALFSLNQMAYLWRTKSYRSVGVIYFLPPILVVIGAVVIFLRIIDDPTVPLSIAAYLCLIYGLAELCYLLIFRGKAPSKSDCAMVGGTEPSTEPTTPALDNATTEDDTIEKSMGDSALPDQNTI